MVDAAGDYVQGKTIDQTTGTAFGVDGNIVISQQPSEPKPTQTMDMVVNLDSSSAWVGSYSVTSGSDVANVAAFAGAYPADRRLHAHRGDHGDGRLRCRV